MKTVNFTIILKENDITDAQADALYHVGASDCTPGVSCGQAHVEFDRVAPTMIDAVESAIRQIKSVGLTPICFRGDFREYEPQPFVFKELEGSFMEHEYRASIKRWLDNCPPTPTVELYKLLEDYKKLQDDYDEMAHRFSCVLDYATGGMMSKTNYTKEAMEAAIEDHIRKLIDDETEDLRKQLEEEEVGPFPGRWWLNFSKDDTITGPYSSREDAALAAESYLDSEQPYDGGMVAIVETLPIDFGEYPTFYKDIPTEKKVRWELFRGKK